MAGDGTTGTRRFCGAPPTPVTRHRAPRWWQEAALVLLGYWLYSLTRNAIHTDEARALRHGRAVQHLQEHLGLSFELPVNRWVAAHTYVAQLMNYYYATLHFVVTFGVLVWIFRTRPRIYRGVRTVLFSTTLVALASFYLYPLAPPRLLPQYGYVDTLVRFHTWGSLADPKIAARSDQYAAMPSLHVAWALWAGLILFLCARRMWIRVAGLCYPAGTFVVVIGTANHFAVDAVGGVAALAAGFALQYLLAGHTAGQPARPGGVSYEGASAA